LRSGDYFQIVLIVGGLVATCLFGAFFYRELFPEYKIYQKAYVQLEEFRSTYTGQPVPPFEYGVKQIVIPKEDKGPETIDRCVSCHVAGKLSHFSPTMIARDVNGNILYDENGIPKKVPNPNYIWKKLDEKVEDLSDPRVNENLISTGNAKEAKARIAEAEKLKNLKVAHVGEKEYDMTKVLAMHPLIARETRPFEYHPVEEYGCTVCHGGNGRGLVTDRAHGPVFDEQYEEADMGPTPQFLEEDPKNDPRFSNVFNHKPGHRLLFQTTPILPGELMQAKCVQCHQPTEQQLGSTVNAVEHFTGLKEKQLDVIQKAFLNEQRAFLTLWSLKEKIEKQGIENTYREFQEKRKDFSLGKQELLEVEKNLDFLRKTRDQADKEKWWEVEVLEKIEQQLEEMTGSLNTAENLAGQASTTEELAPVIIEKADKETEGSLFKKANKLIEGRRAQINAEKIRSPLKKAVKELPEAKPFETDIDRLTRSYQRGKELYISQACYACHKIAGFARGGVGPELTLTGNGYPWFIKESMVWPQADLKTSTMPNYRLDHEELEDLMTFLLAQRTENLATSDFQKRVDLKTWEEGRKEYWEEPIPPNEIRSLDRSMTVFATQGCAACHRLKGYTSNVGFSMEKNDPDFNEQFQERMWFRELIPEDLLGSRMVEVIDANEGEIDSRIVDNVRKGSLLEKLEERYPKLIESFYPSFKYAFRAKNHFYRSMAEKEEDKQKKEQILQELQNWKERVRRVMMMYVQEYGLGRLIGPRPSYSGIYRSDQWLMEHFWNPQEHVAKSIMPVLPFDNTKFLALTYMLDEIGKKNREGLREVWDNRGFNPAFAYEVLCSQCHGENLAGNGPVSEWIYPIPKNLRNAHYLRNLTKERAVHSIVYGISGGPMAPWGQHPGGKPFDNDTPVLTRSEIETLVSWIFRDLPGEKVIEKEEDVLKWKYSPEDFIEEIKNSRQELKGKDELSLLFQTDAPLYAQAGMPTPPQEISVEEVFDIVDKPTMLRDKSYYIKKEYYTKENLAEGKRLFNLNCAVCHGAEGDGAGIRAGTMIEAKPRMLTNLDWLDTRDDLRLLRSLKYGVTGTSMFGWGDQTTAIQRMQMIMYVRSLSSQRQTYDRFENTLYDVFDTLIWTIQDERRHGYAKLDKIEELLEQINEQRIILEAGIDVKIPDQEKIQELYEKELALRREVNAYKRADLQLQVLIEQVKKERELFEKLGRQIFAIYGDDPLFAKYMKLVQKNERQFEEKEGRLVDRNVSNGSLLDLKKEIIKKVDETIKKLEDQKKKESGKILSSEQREKLQEIEEKLKQNRQLKFELLTSFSEIEKTRQDQRKTFDDYQKRMKELAA